MGDKLSKREMAENLSLAVSIEEIVIDTAAELLRKNTDKIAEKFSNSDCSNKLFDFSTDYLHNDINLILLDFLTECRDKYGYKVVEDEV